jgi:glycosyltransferase involved in cell wall biosynthesis
VGEVDVALLRQAAAVSVQAPSDARFVVEATYRLLPLGWRKYARDAGLSRALSRYVDLRAYDLICARYLGPISKVVLPGEVPVIVDLDDVGYSYSEAGLAPRNWIAGLKAAAKHTLERRALRRYRHFFFVSSRDRARLASLDGVVLPNIPVPPPAEPDPRSAGNTILFVGALWYGPNREGVRRFLERCWPAILREMPGARLLLAGAAPQAARSEWARHTNVTAPGFVPDLAAVYAQAAFTIVPIFSGGGTNIKVLESLSHARACMTTRFCYEGFRPNLVAGEHLLVAEDDDQLVRGCLRLMRDADLRQALATNGHARVAAAYGYEAFAAVVADWVHHVVGGGGRRRYDVAQLRGA